MQNTFNSDNELWTEIALSGGWIEVLAGADNLTQEEGDRLTGIVAFGVANSYLKWRQVNEFVYLLKQMLQRKPGTTD